MTWAQAWAATRSRSCSPTSRNSGTRSARCSTIWKSSSSSALVLRSNMLVAERVDDILPMLITAMERVAEQDKALQPSVAGRI